MYPSLNVTAQEFDSSTISIRSDSLYSLYSACEKHAVFSDLFALYPQIRVVIDTNIILAELLFVTTKRKQSTARTVLREVLDAGVIVTVAPLEAHEEVAKHIPRLARERRVAVKSFDDAWAELQSRIKFQAVTKPGRSMEGSYRDPNDLPFVDLYFESGADAVLTSDKDIAAMGAKAVGPEVLLPIREYARAKAPEVTLRIGGALVVGIPIAALVGLLKLLAATVRAFRNLSAELQILLLAAVALAFLHPASRKALSSLFQSVSSGLTGSATIFGELIGELSLRYALAEAELKPKQMAVAAAMQSIHEAVSQVTNVTNKRRELSSELRGGSR